LDLGAGSGRHLPFLAGHGYRVLALDRVDLAPAVDNNRSLWPKNYIPFPYFVQGEAQQLPFAQETMAAVVAWGSLHYGSLEQMHKSISEILRILRPGGVLWGTLRAESDNYLPRGHQKSTKEWLIDSGDISGALVTFVEEKDLPGIFQKFADFHYGYMERSPLGQPKKRISHFFYQAKKRQ
jgi:SAM-dependent methyltransferase